MSRIIFATLVLTVCAFVTACGEANTPPKVEKMPFSGAPDRTAVDMAVTGEARAAMGTIKDRLKIMWKMNYEGNADKLFKAVGGPMTEAKANQHLGGSLDSNNYKTTDYTITHMGGTKFNISAAAGTPKYIQQDFDLTQ
ncbi:MAG: hypothetical protein IT462_07215 [Planctomycetes bacterium]|nr:hypothetical protein [Planctomycetota bacterium]